MSTNPPRRSHGLQRAGVLAALVIGTFLSTATCHAEDKPDSQPDFTQFKPQDYQRPYGPKAPWNVPLKGIPHHPESSLWVERLWRLSTAARPGNFNLGGFESYSYPVYLAGDATAFVPVRSLHPDWGNLHGKVVPWNPNWKPAAGSDGQIIILDPTTGREWNLWQVRFDGQTLNIGNGNLVDGDYRSKEDGFPSSRGAGIPYLAMLTRPEEIMQGAIRHALSMPAKNPSSTLFVPPATKTDGDKFGIPEGVPEGMRFGLRVMDDEIEDWIRQLPGELGETTRRSARIIARALRDYGWVITDNSGGAFFQFEHNNTAGEKWKALGLDKVKIAGKEYPQDLLDGLLTIQRMYAVVPSDQYPTNTLGQPPDLKTGPNADLGGALLMPANDEWNRDVSKDPVDPRSDAIIASIGAEKGLHEDFGVVWQGAPAGISYYVVSGGQPKVPVIFNEGKDESDPGPYPIPPDAWIEGGPKSDGDRHVLVLDKDSWKLYEIYRAFPVDGGKSWHAYSGSVFDLKAPAPRPAGWTSADAAGLPILPGLARYDEICGTQKLTHALRFTVKKSRRAYVPPATHFASPHKDENLPPMGMRVRLKASFDTSQYTGAARVILEGLKTHGMILADNGGDWFISGAPDERWVSDELTPLRRVKGKDFEVVKMGPLTTR